MANLQSTGELTTKSTNGGLLVTLVNFEAYQSDEVDDQPANQPAANQQLTSDQPAANQRLTTTKESNKDNKEKGKEYPLTPQTKKVLG